jgi:peptidoglycan biosynthesis protein MviN/MurJ (putative lipid II flippase)
MIPAIHLFIAMFAKILMNVLFVPIWGIQGAALSAVLAFAIATILNIIVIRRRIGVILPMSIYLIRTGIAIACMSAILVVLVWGVPVFISEYTEILTSGRLFNTGLAGLAILTGIVVYIAVLIRLGVLTPQELAHVPGGRRRIVPLLKKLRLINT